MAEPVSSDTLLAENRRLKDQLAGASKTIGALQQLLEKAINEAAGESSKNAEILEELGLAKLIVNQSPAVLFRRKAGDTPTLEYVSENLTRFGYEPEDFMAERVSFKDIVHKDDQERVTEEINRYAEDDLEEYTQVYRILTKDGDIRWVEDQTSVVRDEQGNKIHNQGILIDITERKNAEEKLRKSEEKFRRIVETAAEGFLLMDEDFRIIDVNQAYCKMLGYQRQDLLGKMVHDFAADDFKSFLRANQELFLSAEQREFEGEVMASDGRIIPILVHGNTLRDDHGAAIGNMAFITDMTEHKKALVLAGEVQKSLLPSKMPQVNGLDIAGRNVSCDEIGGDYYDFIWRPGSQKGAFSIVVGDISGHGVDSALLMTTARAFLRMRASQPGSISEIVSAMNNHLAQDVLDTGKFMTLFCLNIDPETGQLNWVRAGHDPALVYSPKTDAFDELKGSGIALGVSDGFEYIENHKEGLQNDQIIAIGTDGIWEAFNTSGEMFGKKRFKDIIRANANLNAEGILNAVYGALNSFTLGKKSEDDITLVIVKVDGLQS
ncbi:MAG: SpoIIE family protein phosphatase [Desulfocapsaceae bacterium]